MGCKQSGQQQGQQDQGSDDALFEQGFSRKKDRQIKKGRQLGGPSGRDEPRHQFKLKPP
jgi:hypothetical protein